MSVENKNSKIERAQRLLAVALASERRRKLSECFSPDDLESRPTEPQLEALRGIQKYLIRYVRAGNQAGKSLLSARELTWILTNTHPYFQRPARWGSGPLLILIAGQDRLQMETNLWRRLLLPFLDPSDWHETKSGGQLVSVEHRSEGHQIVFLSHNNASEDDIKHMQSYAAHWVWVDEMPKTKRVLEELQRRIDAKEGRFIATFTQKVRNEDIRLFVDAADPSVAHVYRLSKLDNPIYADRKPAELAKLAGLSEQEKNAILYGDWLGADLQIYSVDPSVYVDDLVGYSPSWRHVLAVDPAMASKLGYVLVAECPKTSRWWIVDADYIEGISTPTALVYAVESRVKGKNIVLRVYDPAETWFSRQAAEMPGGEKWYYQSVPRKSERRDELISNFREALGKRIKMWRGRTGKLQSELSRMQWSEVNPGKIANSSKYHLHDAALYALDRLPEAQVHYEHKTYADYLIAQDNKRQVLEAAAAKAKVKKYRRSSRNWTAR